QNAGPIRRWKFLEKKIAEAVQNVAAGQAIDRVTFDRSRNGVCPRDFRRAPENTRVTIAALKLARPSAQGATRWKTSVVVATVEGHGQRELSKVVDTGYTLGGIFGPRERRQEQSGQDTDHRDHNQQLDQSESVTPHRVPRRPAPPGSRSIHTFYLIGPEL